MINPDSSQLPVVVTKSPGNGFRWFHIVIGTPMLVMAAIIGGSPSGRSEAFLAFTMIIAISGTCEYFRYRIKRAYSCRYEIDAEGVHYSDRTHTWFEPLSSYESLDWHEGVPSDLELRSIEWRAELRHGSNPDLSVELVSSGFFSGNRDNDHMVWRSAVRALGVPGRQFGGSGVETIEVKAPAPVVVNGDIALAPIPPDAGQTGHCVPVRRSMLAWGVAIFLSSCGIYLLMQEVLYRSWDAVLAESGGILAVFLIGLATVWIWVLLGFRFQITSGTIEFITSLGPIEYRKQRIEENQLREIVVYKGPLGMGPATLVLQFEERAGIRIIGVKLSDAEAVKRFFLDNTG